MSTWTDTALKSFAAAFVNESRAQLAAVAREHFDREGRGTLAITVRGPRPTAAELREIKIGYRPIAEYQRLTASATGAMRAGVERTVQLIQTYKPLTEAVCTVVAGPQFLTVSFVMPLDEAKPVSEADIAH